MIDHHPKIDKERFRGEYTQRCIDSWTSIGTDTMSVPVQIESYLKRHIVVPCDCDYEGCEGWGMVPLSCYADWLELDGEWFLEPEELRKEKERHPVPGVS